MTRRRKSKSSWVPPVISDDEVHIQLQSDKADQNGDHAFIQSWMGAVIDPVNNPTGQRAQVVRTNLVEKVKKTVKAGLIVTVQRAFDRKQIEIREGTKNIEGIVSSFVDRRGRYAK